MTIRKGIRHITAGLQRCRSPSRGLIVLLLFKAVRNLLMESCARSQIGGIIVRINTDPLYSSCKTCVFCIVPLHGSAGIVAAFRQNPAPGPGIFSVFFSFAQKIDAFDIPQLGFLSWLFFRSAHSCSILLSL